MFINKVTVESIRRETGLVYQVKINGVLYSEYKDYDKAMMVARRFELNLKEQAYHD